MLPVADCKSTCKNIISKSLAVTCNLADIIYLVE